MEKMEGTQMGTLPKEVLKSLIKEYDIKEAKDIKAMLKDLFAETIQEMLTSELDEELGYSKYDYKNKKGTNSRNGSSPKQVKSEYGPIDLNIPRDRKGEFEPQIVKKNQVDVSGIEDQILSMYAKGMTNRDIENHINELYGFEASPTLISRITDKIIPLAKDWQSRPLEEIYAIVFMDAIHYNVRKDGAVVKKAAYILIGIDLDGEKDVLGIWIGENESAKFWLGVLTDVKNRGVKDILISSVDGLTGFSEAIRAVFPQTEIQRCIVHQIRNSTKYVSYKDLKAFVADLKEIYQAATEEKALEALLQLEEKWAAKYPHAIKSWKNNWAELSTFFKYPLEIRKIIYTTNSIESYNRQLRKVTKPKSIFPTDDSLFKMLYLATMDITKKWTGRIQNWIQIRAQLNIHFEERIPKKYI
jgi:putative transposase